MNQKSTDPKRNLTEAEWTEIVTLDYVLTHNYSENPEKDLKRYRELSDKRWGKIFQNILDDHNNAPLGRQEHSKEFTRLDRIKLFFKRLFADDSKTVFQDRKDIFDDRKIEFEDRKTEFEDRKTVFHGQ